ncbi:hypothetical protein A3A79_03645 [Candidatus Gottesmanbacteria bacterium RIFCSPLOWO2_01_FULL_43_11b]|uniref:Uncharacterized protein n=1 Tax=Candidatus Gottesmanbacteria bacterium RIFCSPLOWO2_01_FULL_43_11b TaxID=1798392 RepID=A0A1F6AHS6_9BACT|nr:MAG: hypothetical protein A3A79_03645 [Candidatus Gottesmanbacteria bacterium RIFCSPLOWO2_01_FULL_43_11b]
MKINTVLYGSAKVTDVSEDKIFETINRVVLLRIKTMILKNLGKEDVFAFKEVVKKNDPKLFFDFAYKRIPHLADKIHSEIRQLSLELQKTQ